MSWLDIIQTTLSLAALAAVLWSALTMPRLISQRLDQWTGRPASPGFPAVPGIPERVMATEDGVRRIEAVLATQGEQLSQIHHELHPNSGTSIKDAVGRIEGRQIRDGEVLSDLQARMSESERDRQCLHEALATINQKEA